MPMDLSHRAYLEESMDVLSTYGEYRRCLHDLDSVSRLVLAHRATLHFLNRIAATNPTQPINILDVACGDGSMLRRLAKWAAKRGLSVRLTGLDLNPWAIDVAREFPNTTPPIEYVVSDVFAYEPLQPIDVILSAHFTHHLENHDIIRFLNWMERNARLGWFVNDLHRHPNPYRLFRLLGAVAPWHPIIISDGLISIRRAFTVDDWQACVLAAGIGEAVPAEEFPARVTVTRLKTPSQLLPA
ncbi:methyltransferase domain-containing protein [Granulicella sibirica]|uniref:Methyltransferase n=1 Tax=Granulicella sibirica TaxID=2479048 RepID=A0A4Q0T2N9_9BACT|nr:methyltransferase domain-containing protein [Granulicella sibirica]RXH57935.1 methyltransferase [Granulicella sibirica]